MKSPYLKQRTRRNFDQLERRRRLGMKLLARGVMQAEVARQCHVSETTVFRWKEAITKKGPSAWKRGRLGRPPIQRRTARDQGHSRLRGAGFSLFPRGSRG